MLSTPPQHGKTITTIHALVYALLKDPKKRCVYVTYGASRAWDMNGDALNLAHEAGLECHGNRGHWVTPKGGGVMATGIGGPLTGYAVDGLLIVDDPVKNAEEAESVVYREKTLRWFQSTAMTRVHQHASVIIIQTRWHPDDLAGQLTRSGWETINLPAVNDGSDPDRELGAPLDPIRYPLDYLAQLRREIGEHTWSAMYQGNPVPRGGEVFQGIRFFEDVPRTGYRIGVGIDLAYTRSSKSDYSTIVVMLELGGIYHVVECIRVQVRAPEFKTILEKVLRQYPARPRWYCSGVELGAADLIGGIDAQNAHADKFLRAQPVAAEWNAGQIYVLKDAPWLDVFRGEICHFTGVNDAHDDIIDAFAAAYDSIHTSAGDYESLTEASGW